MTGTAVLSDCGVYRYRLERPLDPAGRGPIVFVMLNPSTADAELDDPTIRRCRGFANREAATRLVVVNLFAYRATKPADLELAADPVGPLNDAHLLAALDETRAGGRVVAAWGAQPRARAHGLAFRAMAADLGVELYALGLTADGSPRHPLYVRGNAKPVPFLG